MAEAVIMPKAGITVESCIISEWTVKAGDEVKIGDILFTYETDKAVFECESTAGGVILEIFYEAGDEVRCLAPVCAIGKAGEDISALRPDSIAHTPKAAASRELAVDISAAPVIPPAHVIPRSVSGSSGVSPRAKNLAERAGVDASQASATGPNGRVIERDVRTLMAEGPAAQAASEPATEIPEYEDVKFSGIRRSIAKTMFQSLQGMAQLTHHHSFDASGIQSYRKTLKALEGDYAGITLGDMILFAVSRTLLKYPDLNANIVEENAARRFRHVNLGVAVNTDRGLMVPTVFRADEKSLLEISREVKELAAMCRGGSINPDLLQGGSFTVSNLGAANVEMFTPVINPPQTGILGVCNIVQRPRSGRDGTIELYPAMGISLTYDHRAIDGAPASQFMTDLSRSLESFTALLAL